MTAARNPQELNSQIQKFTKSPWPGCAKEAFIANGVIYRVFHGTRSNYLPSIRMEGLRAPAGTGPGWFMLTTRADVARDYAAGYADAEHPGVVIEYHIPVVKVQDLLFAAREQHALGKSHALRFGQVLPASMIASIHPASAITGPGWRAGDEEGVSDPGWLTPAR